MEELRSFYSHFFIYLLINAFFFVIDMLTSPGRWWFYWPMLGWGIGLFVHFMGVFVIGRAFGKDWEEKKIRELMDRDQ